MQLWIIQVETFRNSFVVVVVVAVLRLVCWLFGWFSFVFSSGKTSKDVRSRLRNQCKEMFQVSKRKVVKGHCEKDACEGKKADLTNTTKLCISHSPYLDNYVCILILKNVQLTG